MYRSTLEKHLAPYFDRPAEKVGMYEWLRLLDNIVKNNSANTAAVGLLDVDSPIVQEIDRCSMVNVCV